VSETLPGDRLRFRRVLAAPPARVFALWTDPAAIRQWFGGFQTEVVEVSLDLRAGGAYTISVRHAAGESRISGQFLVVEVPVRLVYTWSLAGALGRTVETTVSVEFRAAAEGTELVLEHGPFADPLVQGLHKQGWEDCFQALQTLLRTASRQAP